MMADRITADRRSWNMSRIRGRDTKPEIQVRSLLHRMGYRFRVCRTDLPGKPDIVLPKHKTVVFVHGCFWHRHKGCRFAYTPKSRSKFWASKFEANVKRDREVSRQLRRLGWKVLIVWTCALANPEALRKSLSAIGRSGAHDVKSGDS